MFEFFFVCLDLFLCVFDGFGGVFVFYVQCELVSFFQVVQVGVGDVVVFFQVGVVVDYFIYDL